MTNGAARISLVVSVCVSTPALAQSDQWGAGPGGNAARNSVSAVAGPSTPDLIWDGSTRSDILETQPFIGQSSDGSFYVVTGRIASFTIPTGSWIVCQDLLTGALRWEVQVPFIDRSGDPDFEDEWRGRVIGVHDDRVYVSRAGNTRSAPVYALDAADGSIIWESDDLITDGSTEGASFASDGDLIIGSGPAGASNQIPGNIIRIDADTGATVWKTDRSCPTSNGCQAAVANGTVYYYQAGAFGPVITAADLATGAELYSSVSGDLEGGLIQQVGPLVSPDGTIYVARGQQGLPGDFPGTEFDTFFAVDDTGASLDVRWGIPAGFTPFATFGAASDGSVYAYRTPEDAAGALTGDLEVLRLDPLTGAILDRSALLPTTTIAPSPRVAIGADDTVYLSTEEILISLTPDLQENWRIDDWVDLGFPALGGDGVLVVSSGGFDLRAFRSAVCLPDTNGDGELTPGDFTAWVLAFNFQSPACDQNGDGQCTPGDFNAWVLNFNAGC
ncbi:MAG: PQQ-binding-like beta-propeller repeat protein [Planctomycetota bacterium]